VTGGTTGAEPIYLVIDDILELYAAIISSTADQAADHLRDRGGVESALNRPAMHAHYEAADLPLQAAVLAHGLAEGQFFIDGNKRIGLVAMLTFLEINGVRIEATDRELADWILSLSAGETPGHLAARIRSASRPIV
jgi:death on curing protein